MANKIQLRRDTATNWTSANPLLSAGEVGVDLTNKKIKIGDGTTRWNSLEYWDDKEPNGFDGTYTSLTGKPSLFSGNYVDLTNKPTIPAAQVNSDWNASSGVAQILNKPAIPEDVSDLTDTTNLLSGGVDLSAVDQDILPAVDSDGTTGYTLGSASFKWKELFVSNGSIYIGDVKLSNVAGKLRAVKVINPGEIDEEEDPDDSDAASEIGGGGSSDRLVNGDNEVILDSDGNLTAPGDIVVGGIGGGRLVVNADDGENTSVRWYNMPSNEDHSIIRAYTGNPNDETELNRGRIQLAWQDSDRSGLRIISYDRSNDTSTTHEWTFQGDGGLRFPDGSVQTTAYTGSEVTTGGEPLFVVVNSSGESAYSSNGETWTQVAPFPDGEGSLGLDRVAVHRDFIVYISGDDDLWTAEEPGVQPTLITITSEAEGSYNWNDVQVGGDYVVAVGRFNPAEGDDVPAFAYTTNGSSWTVGTIDPEYIAFTGAKEFTSVDYNGTGWFITASDYNEETAGQGAFYTTDLSAELSEPQFITFTGLDTPPSIDSVTWTGSNWFVLDDDDSILGQRIYVSSGANPLSSTWTQYSLSSIADDYDYRLGMSDNGFYENAGGNGTFMIASSEGQILYTTNAGENWSGIVPNAYTCTIDAVTPGTTTLITEFTMTLGGTDWDGINFNGIEKLTITGATPSDYNGTRYVKTFGVPDSFLNRPNNNRNTNWIPGTYTVVVGEDFTVELVVDAEFYLIDSIITVTGTGVYGWGHEFTISGTELGGTDVIDDIILTAYNFTSVEYRVFTDSECTTSLNSSGFATFEGASAILNRGTYIDAVGYGLNKFLIGNDDEQLLTAPHDDLSVWTIVDNQNNDFQYWNDIGFNADFGGTGAVAGSYLTNSEYSLTLESTGTVTLPSGGTISEGVVTSNPTIQLTPATPDVVSQKLVIKGGTSYNVDQNGISLGMNVNTAGVGDTFEIFVFSNTYADQTLYWWIVPEEGGIADPGSGTVTLDGNFGTITFTVDSDDYEFTVRVSPEDNNYDPNSIGVESLLINGDAPTFGGDHHLHLTTGNLAETSIFLGTDDHNVRTTTDGKIQITTPNEGGNKVWEFGTDGSIVFPTLTVPRGDRTGTLTGQTLMFGGTQDVIISTPNGTVDNNSSQRLVINPGEGATGTSGEGGDIYLYAGRGGDADGSGGDIKIRGGLGGGVGAGGYIDIESGESSAYGNGGDITITARDGGRIVFRTFNSESNSRDLVLDNDGTTTFPGAVINSTMNKTGVPIDTGIPSILSGGMTGLGIADGTYGPFTKGDVTFEVTVSGGSISGYINISSTTSYAVNDTIGQLTSEDLGDTPGQTTNINVDAVDQGFTAIDLTKTINKLTDGNYTLADGVEGQIMYLVRSPETDSEIVIVVVENADGINPLRPFRTYSDFGSIDNTGICTLIFTDGSWKQTGGNWD